jgi:DNA-binding NtrC family response regulator
MTALLFVDDEFVGESLALAQVFADIAWAAPQDLPVLITGETGTGKELVAHAVFRHSRRARKPFLTVNCAGFDENLLDSELFGHEQGAFTGAHKRGLGKLERSHLGTFFLDEVGDMSKRMQAKLLRVLEEKTLERVGGDESVAADVRIIAATHCDLDRAAALGDFRPDLLFRLAVLKIHLPPLRERQGDIPLLVRHYLERYCRDLGMPVPEVSAETMQLLETYPWPGNVRQLQDILHQALQGARSGRLTPDSLPKEVRWPAAGDLPALSIEARVDALIADGWPGIRKAARTHLDRMLVEKAMHATAGNQRSAAKMLGVSPTTLLKMLHALGLHPTDATPPPAAGP